MQSRIIFIVSPSLGILDNWLPVLWELKKRRPDIKITAVIPKVETVSETDPEGIITKFCEEIFDEIVFRSASGFWATSTKLTEAQKLNKRFIYLKTAIKKLVTALRMLAHGAAAVFDPSFKISGDIKAICFDVFVKTKPDCRAILDNFPNVPRFSLLHGLAVEDWNISGGDYDSGRKKYRTTAYVFSKHEVSSYKDNYGLKDEEIKIMGVPRHEKFWVEKIMENSKKDIPASWDKFIFLLSRPAAGGFFTKEEKKAALENIKKLAAEINCKIVVGLHPTEREERNKDGLCEAVFGRNDYGKGWIYSSEHPFLLGKKSIFAASLYSGVAVDMIALDVPVIQMINPKPHDKSGHVMDYKKKALVLSAVNYDELKACVKSISEDKDGVMLPLKKAYSEFFGTAEGSAEAITDDICGVL